MSRSQSIAHLAERVVRCRAGLGLSQSALAARLGVSFATVNRWERGHTSPSAEMLHRLEALERLTLSGDPASRPGALPESRARFFGRERELTTISQALKENRLVTIAGPGGSGKTRLALEVVRRGLGAHSVECWFVSLGELGPGSDVSGAVARLIEPAHTGEPFEAIAARLGDVPSLLILDNCEHLIEEVSGLAVRLLDQFPGLRVLATSREPLHAASGNVIRLEPFAPGDGAAAELFLDRAARAGWASRDEDLPAVRELCEALDGLPLAIEIAASLAPAIAPASLRARLDERLALLVTAEADRPSRHHGLRAALAWSYELLTVPERRLFERLSVFPGGFTLEAAEAACSSGDDALTETAVLLSLASLVRKSLVQVRPGVRVPIYGMLESVRIFAAEVASARPGDLEVTRKRLVEWAVNLASAAEEKLEGKQQEVWLRALDDQAGAWRAALQIAIGSGRTLEAITLVGSLHRYWHTRSFVREGLDWTTQALRLPGKVPAALRAKALLGAGVFARQRGDFATAAGFLETYLDTQLELGDIVGIARAHNSLAGALHGAGRSAEARAMLEAGLEYWRLAGDSRGLASALSNLGVIACDNGDYDSAERLGREALEIRRNLGHPGSIAISLENLATVALRSGRLADAQSRFSEALIKYMALHEPDGTATCLEGFAALAANRDSPETAILLYGAAGALREEIDVAASPGDAAFHDAIRRRLREPDSAWFDAVIERGRTLSREEYLALATRSGTIQPPQLTARERDVLHLLVSGDSNKEIARRLRLSERTVNGHLTSIYRKLGARGRTDAVALAFRTRIT